MVVVDFLKRISSILVNFYSFRKKEFFLCVVVLLFSFFLGLIYNLYIKAPTDFPEGRVFPIQKGLTLSEIANFLEKNKVVRSSFWFQNVTILMGGEDEIDAGDYYFDKKINSINVSRRIIKGDQNLIPIKVTIPEGYNVSEITNLLKSKMVNNFDYKKFFDIAKKEEGYLFPDTYFLFPNSTPYGAFSIMKNNFSDKISSVQDDIKKFGKPLKDIVIMASIVEEEGRTMETRKIIAGILWKRLKMGMPLQVDATFKYINGKNSFTLSTDDLKIDSPYNTYKYRGLPPTAICNPGLDAIKATIYPTETKYLYFLTDKNGVMHYATNFADHVKNKELYLK